MRRLLLAAATLLLFAQLTAQTIDRYQIGMTEAGIVLNGPATTEPLVLELNTEPQAVDFGVANPTVPFETDEAGQLVLLKLNDEYGLVHVARTEAGYRVRKIPMWLSIVPPLLAIGLALVFKEVIVSLVVGIWAGAFVAGGLRLESMYYFLRSVFNVIERYVINALADSGHLSVIVFSLLIGGMVAIISRNGGMAGVVLALSKYAKTPRSTQFVTWFLGIAIFFDDYANTLIVGNTMRSATDKFNISREKLAYIVDSTAAPVAAVAFITTWIGAELTYISDGIALLDGFEDRSAYGIFASSLKYSFYPILTLAFIAMLIYSRRDYGPMLEAETRARVHGLPYGPQNATDAADEDHNVEDLNPVANAPIRWYHGVVPVLTVILVTIFGLLDTGLTSVYNDQVTAGTATGSGWGAVWRGMDDGGFFLKLGSVIGAADSYVALIWASLSGVVVAIAMTVGARIMNLGRTMGTMVTGFKTMLPAIIILTLAWALAGTTEDLHTAVFLSDALRDSLNPYLMPVLTFVLAAFIAFSTGSSWSTMAILYPIVIPTTWAVCQTNGVDPVVAEEILLNVIAVTLAASVLGDHCSPISDTTILSSLASDCNHIAHVRTQLPYALTVGSVALVCAGVSTLLGGGWWISLGLVLVSLAVLAAVIWRLGRVVEPSAG